MQIKSFSLFYELISHIGRVETHRGKNGEIRIKNHEKFIQETADDLINYFRTKFEDI